MIERKEFDLLADIAGLLKKYGPETFEALADSIASHETSQNLVELLQTTARISRTAPTSNHEIGKRKATRSIRDDLASIETVDPQKFALLTDLYRALQERSILPTLRELRNFAADCDLPAIKADARQKAITPFIRSLIQLPTSELAEKLRGVESYSRNDKGLQGWSEIILGR
jgi:ABC-type transporter Mla MlaB component